MPNGYPYEGGAVVELSDEQYAQINPTVFDDGVLIDRGEARSSLGESDVLRTIEVPIDLADITAVGAVKKVKPGFAGTIASVEVIARTPASTAAKDIDLAVRVNSGTAAATVTLLTASLNARGESVSSANIAANNVFDDNDDIEIRCTEATAVFVEGSVLVRLTLAVT
jgi:hypothetical protein